MKSLDSKSIVAAGVLGIFMLAAVVFSLAQPKLANGSTLSYAVPKVATSSLITVGPQNVVTIASNLSTCVDRVIGTQAQPIMLSFSPLVIPTVSQGHVQAGSSSVAYNNGDYGCPAITAYAAASTSITVTVFAQ